MHDLKHISMVHGLIIQKHEITRDFQENKKIYFLLIINYMLRNHVVHSICILVPEFKGIKETATIHEKFDIKIEYNGEHIKDNDINIIYNKYGYIDINTDKMVRKKLMCF